MQNSFLSATSSRVDRQKLALAIEVVLASCFIGLCSQIKIPLIFTSVPLTIQTSAIMLVATYLGSYRGALAVTLYLIQGASGLPVFAGGAGGIHHIFGPTGGYLLAYIIQVCFIGWAIEKKKYQGKAIIILFLSILLQLGMGSLWLSYFIGLKNCLMLGFSPFLISECFRALIIAAHISHKLKKDCQ